MGWEGDERDKCGIQRSRLRFQVSIFECRSQESLSGVEGFLCLSASQTDSIVGSKVRTYPDFLCLA